MYIQKNTATRYVVYNYVCVSVCAYISCEYCAWDLPHLSLALAFHLSSPLVLFWVIDGYIFVTGDRWVHSQKSCMHMHTGLHTSPYCIQT